MSVILDALRKLDHEKSSRRSGTPNIAVEIARADLPRPRKRILLYFVAVSIATAAITYFVTAEFGFLLKSLPPTTIDSPPSNHLHLLHGDREGQWAISVSGPWRLCFMILP